MSSSATHSLFLHLLSAAIWDKPANAKLFEELSTKTWRDIEHIAKRQTVSALIADKALSLPEGSLPPKEVSVRFMADISHKKHQNKRMIKVLAYIKEAYGEAGMPFCLLKGLSNGVNYPQPLLRSAGDIDLLLYRKGDYERGKLWCKERGIEIEDADHIHYAFDKDGIRIENHRRISYFDNKRYDGLFRQWEAELSNKENFGSVQIDNITVKQLPVEMKAFFIFQHMFRHFVHLGVGFRQYCDWLLFLAKHRDEIDATRFTATAQSYALLYPMQLFARDAVKHLDAPKEIFPFEMIEGGKHANWIIEDVLNSGNFGFHRVGKQRPQEKLRGMWFSYKTTVARSVKFGAIAPQHIRMLPMKKLITRLKIGFR